MDRQTIIDACRDILAATDRILDAIGQDQDVRLAPGEPGTPGEPEKSTLERNGNHISKGET